MRYTRAQADRLAGTLHDLPTTEPKRLFKRLQLVTYLSPQIVGLQERCYPLAAIAVQLTADGLQIGEASLARRIGDAGAGAAAPGRALRPPPGKSHGAEVIPSWGHI